MRNKGFTLIELLAVIVILAIIALIATPIVLGIINDSRKSSERETAKLIVSNFELAYSTAYMSGEVAGSEPTLDRVMEKFNMDGAEVTGNATSGYTVTSKSGSVICTTSVVERRAKLTCTITGDSEFNEGESREVTVASQS